MSDPAWESLAREEVRRIQREFQSRLAAVRATVESNGGDGNAFLRSTALNVHLGTDPDGAWQGFPVVQRPWALYEAAFARRGLAIEDLGPLTSFGHHHPRLSPERQELQRMLKNVRR
jgi:hypothetical protein